MLSIRAINYNYTVNKRVITRTISLHSLHILTRFLILLFFFFFILISLSSFLLRIFSFICLFISVQSTRKLLLNVNSISESYNIAFFFFQVFTFLVCLDIAGKSEKFLLIFEVLFMLVTFHSRCL